MPVRELAPGEEIIPIQGTARELRPDEEVLPFNEDTSLKIDIGGREPTPEELAEIERQKFIESRNPVDRFGRGANVGLAETFGAPVDLTNFLLGLTGLPVSEEPMLGSQQLRRAFAAFGIAPPVGQDDPDNLPGSMGRVTGQATGFLTGAVGPVTRATSAVQTGVRAAPTTVRGAIVQDIGKSALDKPGRFLAAEAVSAGTAGAGGFIAREKFPDSEAASFIGEVLGGITPATAVGATRLAGSAISRIPGSGIVPTITGIRLVRAMVKPFGKVGRRRRAEDRLQGAARDPEKAATELRGEFDETLPEAGLTPVQKTGDEGLLSLERSVIDSSEQLKGEADEQIAQATEAIRRSIDDFGEHVPIEKTEVALDEGRAYIQSLMDTRMRIAALKADERIAALGPNATREQANLITREEVVAAREAINKQVNEIWSAVPESLIIKTNNSRDALDGFLAGPIADQGDVPDIAARVLDNVGEETTVKELQSLRSKLLEESRKAAAAGESNKARISSELAEAVLEDLGAQRDNVTGEAGEALRAALDATAHMKQTFDRGPVGRILAVDRRGAPKVPEELTLETTVGRGGPRARVETQAILDAVDTPALRGAVEDFLLDDFNRRALTGNRIDSKKGQAFLKRHQDVLEDFPELRTKMEAAIEAGDKASLAADKAKGLARRLGDPRVSRAAVFLKEPVEGAMERIAKSPRPDRTMREIVKQARRDPTGDAVKGLKTGLGDLLLSRSSTNKETVKGEFILSGTKLKRLLVDGPVSKMVKTLFSPEEQKRLLEIADVAEKVHKAVIATPKSEGIIADNPSLLFATLARIAGAQVGRKVATATGGGTVQTPGIMSGLFRNALTAATQDPARRLLIDAIGNEDLFAALLATGQKTTRKEIRKQLNAWLLSIGAEQIEDDK
jgi:hypothetical protein